MPEIAYEWRGERASHLAIRNDQPFGRAAQPLKVPWGPAGSGMENLPGIFLPLTPFTVSVEAAYVMTAKAIASELTSRAFSLTLSKVSHSRW